MNLLSFGLGFIVGVVAILALALYLIQQKPIYSDAPLCPRCAAQMKENPRVQKAIIITYFIKSGLKSFNCPGCGVELKLMYRKVDGR